MPAAGTSLTVESLSQARARATKPEPPSQSCRARARANRFILLMSSEILALILSESDLSQFIIKLRNHFNSDFLVKNRPVVRTLCILPGNTL